MGIHRKRNFADIGKVQQSNFKAVPIKHKEWNDDNRDKTTRRYAADVRKTVEAADIIIEVLDARDPLGSRSKQIEDEVIRRGKRLVLLLNKIDLVPKSNVRDWLKNLRQQYPTIAFKASTQEQQNKLGRVNKANLHTDSAKCIGADLVMKLLKNYCRNKDIKTLIRVGIVGYPNVGKSSIINSLKRKRACLTGATPGVTKQLQEVELDSNIRLIDSPGVVLAARDQFDAVEVALKNALRVESLRDPVSPVIAILRRCRVDVLMAHFNIAAYENHEHFLALVARRLGRLKKGGRPDVEAAARHVLNEWNGGKLRYYTELPIAQINQDILSSELVTEVAKEFDLDALDEDVRVLIDELPEDEMDVRTDAPTSSIHVLSAPVDEIFEPEIVEVEEKYDISDNVVIESEEKNVRPDEVTKVTMPTSMKIDGNSQINRAIQLAVKKNKKKQRKMEKRVLRMADAFQSLGHAEVKMEIDM